MPRGRLAYFSVWDVAERRVAVLGAGSFVGESLITMLQGYGWQVVGFSRRHLGDPTGISAVSEQLPFWISLIPIDALAGFANLMDSYGVRRIVALSSTSRFSKKESADPAERNGARQIAEGETWLATWSATKNAQCIILRPTLIYGRGRDKNISEIARFIRRFGFFPLLGKASGLRQPVHVDDVAWACVAAVEALDVECRTYNLSGGETLTYREMVCRIFTALGRQPKLLVLPLRIFALSVSFVRLLPRYRSWRLTMAERMNSDLVFDHTEAARDLGFAPRSFTLAPQDVGLSE